MTRLSMTYTSGVCAIALVTVNTLANDLAIDVSISYYLFVKMILVVQDVRTGDWAGMHVLRRIMADVALAWHRS